MLKLVVCIIILAAVCCNHVVVTCRTTDDNLINGLRVEVDMLSQKVKILKNQSRANQQKEQLNFLSQEVEALKNQSKVNRQFFLDIFGKGLYVPPHIYIYQLTPGPQSWQRNQQYCQNWGGNLAVYGVRSVENRKKVINNLQISSLFWIGLNDIASEGRWIWVNGEPANSSKINWTKPPDNYGGNEDCVVLHGRSSLPFHVGLAGDVPCSSSYQGLCEKKI